MKASTGIPVAKGKQDNTRNVPALNGAEALVTRGNENSEIQNVSFMSFFFPFSFVGQNYPQEYRDTQTHGKVWRNVELPSTEQDQLRKHLNELDMPKSMRPDRMHP